MKTSVRFATSLVLFALLAGTLQAHPGHHQANGLHLLLGSPFSGVDHLAAWSIAIVGTSLILLRARRDSRPASKAKS
jgi:hydrogenase/urease accessory protein HupE